MTRDEAIAAAIKSKEQWGGGSSEAWLVNALEALGVLKIDEPKSAEHRFIEIINNLPLDFRLSGNIWSAIHASGLKIVEK